MSNVKRSKRTNLPVKKQGDVSLSAGKKSGNGNDRRGRKMDYGKTIKILYGVAIVLAAFTFVVIGIKTVEDLSAERSASTLLNAYKEMESAVPTVQLQATVTPEAVATPEPTPGLDTDTISAEHRVDQENDLVVDESADYVQPDDATIAETEEIIKQIINAVGDDGVIGTIEIPKTGQEYPIIGKWSYKLLKISICRYQGGEPNERDNNLVLIGHNYKSGAHFGNLKKLEVGDEIYLTAKSGERVRYVVYDTEGIAPDNFNALKKYRGESGLTLLTCKNNGNNRLIVRCERKPAESSVSANGTTTNN